MKQDNSNYFFSIGLFQTTYFKNSLESFSKCFRIKWFKSVFYIGCLEKTDWKKQFELSYFKFHLKGVQNAFKIFYKSLKILVQKFATICIWKLCTFGFELELSWFLNKIWKEKVWVNFKSVFLKEVFQNGSKGLKIIWFDSPKVLFQKEFEHVY